VAADARRRSYNRLMTESRGRPPTGTGRVARWLRVRWAVVAVVLFVAIVGWAVPVAATEKIAGQPSPVEPVADVFLSGMTTPRDGEEGLWMSWSLVDTARERRVGSANSDTDLTNSESSIKAWIAADYLRVAQAEGRAATASERADIAAMVRSSDNAAAQRLYRALGGDAILRHLRSVCGVTVSTATPGYWSLTQITAVDATRIFAWVLRTAPTYPGGNDLLTDLRSVDPDDAFGIKAGLPPTKTVSLKNGWMPHSSTTGKWNVNCVAAWDDYVLAVLTRYPVDRPLTYGADVCRDVTAALVERLG
jgi:hypothetical protein